MKTKRETKFALAITALLMLQSVMGFSQSNIQMDLYKQGTQIAEIKVDQLKKEELSVFVKDAQGNTLFTDHSSNADRYLKRLDFANITDGIYSIDIVQAKRLTRKLVEKSENGLIIKSEAYVFHNFINFQDEDKKLLVKFNNAVKEPVSIRITDNEGHILHEETGITSERYATLFNLSKLGKGTYNMSLTSGNFTSDSQIQL